MAAAERHPININSMIPKSKHEFSLLVSESKVPIAVAANGFSVNVSHTAGPAPGCTILRKRGVATTLVFVYPFRASLVLRFQLGFARAPLPASGRTV